MLRTTSLGKVTLICIPYAGGDYFSYRSFDEIMPDDITMYPVELPGRGKRVSEPLNDNMIQLVDDLEEKILPIVQRPYAIYGHSMGALLGYLLIKRLQNKYPLPVHFFVTGARGPSIKREEPLRHKMPLSELKDELKSLGGVSDEVLNNELLMEFYIDILRADFKAIELFEYQETTPFNVPMTVITGLKDKVKYEEAMAWSQETTAEIKFLQFPGDHFFIHPHKMEIVKRIYNDIFNGKLSGEISDFQEKQH